MYLLVQCANIWFFPEVSNFRYILCYKEIPSALFSLYYSQLWEFSLCLNFKEFCVYYHWFHSLYYLFPFFYLFFVCLFGYFFKCTSISIQKIEFIVQITTTKQCRFYQGISVESIKLFDKSEYRIWGNIMTP